MKIYSIYLTYKNIRRLREIIGVLIKHGFSHLVEKTDIKRFIPLRKRLKIKEKVDEKLEVRLRRVLEELGPTYIKFGQMLARRYDLLPANFISELSKLEDKVKPISYDEVFQIISKNYKDDVFNYFKSIEKEPLASASIAQVHRAVLKDGKEVVLKIKKQGIDEVVEDDLRLLFFIARSLEEYSPELKNISLQKIVEEFSKTLKKELNFLNEVVNMEKMKKVFGKEEIILIPEVYKQFCNEDIIVVEYIESIKITEVYKYKENFPEINSLILNSVEVFFRKVFETGFFHGDLHPGNVGISNSNKIVLYDFGNVGFLMPETSKILKNLLITLITKDYNNFVNYLNFLGWFKNEEMGLDFKRDLAEIFEWRTELSLSSLNVIKIIEDVIELMRKYNVYLPYELVGFFRTIILMDAIGKAVIPDFEINKIINEVLKNEITKGTSLKDTIDDIYNFFIDTKRILERTPSKVDKILNKMLNDKFTVDFVHVNLEPLINEMAKTGNRISVSLIVSALIIGTSLVFFSDKGPHIFGYPVLGILGFISATILGFYLLIRIIIARRF